MPDIFDANCPSMNREYFWSSFAEGTGGGLSQVIAVLLVVMWLKSWAFIRRAKWRGQFENAVGLNLF